MFHILSLLFQAELQTCLHWESYGSVNCVCVCENLRAVENSVIIDLGKDDDSAVCSRCFKCYGNQAVQLHMQTVHLGCFLLHCVGANKLCGFCLEFISDAPTTSLIDQLYQQIFGANHPPSAEKNSWGADDFAELPNNDSTCNNDTVWFLTTFASCLKTLFCVKE